VSADLLATIVAATRRIVEVREAQESIDALRMRVERQEPRPVHQLRAALGRSDRLNVIAECKRRSPSKGMLRPQYDPAAIAAGYAAAGAAAISVLTEPTFFDGSLDHLRAVRAVVPLPILRKDFIVSEYQILEAKAAGADAILLIVAALTAVELRSLASCATANGVDALVEVHSVDELSTALDAGAAIIGVNNRNLRTLTVDIAASETLIARIPKHVISVSESGLRTSDDLLRLRQTGYCAFLIGERFMTAADPGAALRELLAGVPCS